VRGVSSAGSPQSNRLLDALMPVVVVATLALGFLYTFAFVYFVPYPGFDYDSSWRVINFDVDCDTLVLDKKKEWCTQSADKLKIGDVLLSVNGVARAHYQDDYTYTPFKNTRPGDLVSLEVQRNGQIINVYWPILGPTGRAQVVRLAGFVLFLPFWLAGTIVYLFFRPKDIRWYLLIFFNYLTALWVVIGAIAFSKIWGSFILVRVLSWILVPIYVHFHLALGYRRLQGDVWHKWGLSVIYGATVAFLILQLREMLPPSAPYVGLMLSILFSIILLLLRAIRPKAPGERAVASLMLTGIVVAFAPGILLWLVPLLTGTTGPSALRTWMATISIALLPFFYVYALYKHKLGALEMRANRALSFYSFLVLYATGVMLIFVTMNRWLQLDSNALTFSLIASVVSLILALASWGPYRRLVNLIAYGNSYDPSEVVAMFANEVPRALDREKLGQLINYRVMTSLLVRQSALVQMTGPEPSLLYARGIDFDLKAWTPEELEGLLEHAGRYIPPDPHPDPKQQWIRLVIPIRVDGRLLGIWLLGGKEPDDFYPQHDIDVLTTLANQIGVTLETIRLFTTLRSRANQLEQAYLELRRADRLKDEFIRNISHELRTPLTAVLGYSELLQVGEGGEITPEQEEMLQIVIDHTKAVINQVNSIIGMQMAKSAQIEKSPVNLADVARASMQEVQILAQRQRNPEDPPLEFAFESPEDLPLVLANRSQMSQVFDNLLSNAVKFSPDGGTIQVQLRVTRHKLQVYTDDLSRTVLEEKPVVEVCIRDQGIGIPAEELEHIWDQFYQVDGSATRRFGGTGLGLALARDIIETHGGKIWVESEVKVGSAFYFVLPIPETEDKPSVDAEPQMAQEASEPEQPPMSKPQPSA